MSWTESGVDPTLPMVLGQVPPTADPFDRLERIGAWEMVIAWAQARQYAEITGFAVTRSPHRRMG